MIKNPLVLVLVFSCSLLFLSACGSAGKNIEQYSDNKPELIAEEFFNGSLTAHGVVKDRSGGVIRYFNASLEGTWQDGTGLIAERFVFNDGEIQFRNWQLIPAGAKDGRKFIGRAEDVVGDAEVITSGNAMFIRYTLQIPYDGSTIDVEVDDRMYLVSDNVLINESKLSYWGFDVGEVVLTIVKSGS